MPTSDFKTDSQERYRYLNGLGCYHETEAVEGVLPIGQNSPQKPALGLYTEKLSGNAFTAPRHENFQTWMYRIMPTAAQSAFKPADQCNWARFGPSSADVSQLTHDPNQIRWDPFEVDPSAHWVQGFRQVAGAGDPAAKQGLGIYVFSAGKNMPDNSAFYSADGDLLVVPQQGDLDIRTELGCLLVRPNEICVIPRGLRYRVDIRNGPARGYALELYQGHFQLPELGPIGSSSLASPRDFQVPVAHFEQTQTAPLSHSENSPEQNYTVFHKYAGTLWQTQLAYTPFDVVAWHGTYYPYKYDLARYCTIGSISFDHPDPSIFTVLTAPSDHPGTAIADFVIFPPRWLVAENTFRPPWYHRNTMSEFMGLISGDYDAKAGGKGGFQPGGASLHNVMAAHGPDAVTHAKASTADLRPQKVGAGSMAFMFESSLFLAVTDWAKKGCGVVQPDYVGESWGRLRPHFVIDPDMSVKSNLVTAAKFEMK